MILVPLSPIPNQSFSITLDENQYDIRLHLCSNIMSIDIVRNNITIQTGIRVVPSYWVIPNRYQEDGNFIFITNDDDYPSYEQFGITQNLIYFSQSEIEVLRGSGT